jgi:hypothetical protein
LTTCSTERTSSTGPDRWSPCRSGSRSAEAAKDLASEGFEVQNLEGGNEAWVALQQLQAEFLDVIFSAKEHFGDSDPSDEEVKGFLRQRMIDQGKSPEEADEFLATMDSGPT